MAVAVPLEFLLGFGLAMLFVDNFPGRRIYYSLLLTPMMVVPAVAGYMFQMLFQSTGPINQILSFHPNLERRGGMAERAPRAPGAVITADVWQWTPMVFLILLAGPGSAGRPAQGGEDARRKLAAALPSDRFTAHANGYHHCAHPPSC